LVGGATTVRRLEAAILRVAEFQCTTLVTGETGCGKEEVARAIHAAGPRSDGPFVAINCGSLPAALAESQLFGHERGAFTGAVGATRGAFRAAHGGVIFLDEIGDLPPELQPKLLQVLERREVTPVGSTRPQPVDVHVIAATHRDLDAAVAAGGFREDLLYRLNTVHLTVPALRDRPKDIPRFVGHFAAHYAAHYDRPLWRPEPAVLERLMAHDWPGNVRQLAQTIQRIYVFADTADAVLDEVLRPACPAAPTTRPVAASTNGTTKSPAQSLEPPTFNLRELRRRTVRAALDETGGHFAQAAKLLGVCPNTMTKLVAEACPERSVAVARRPARPR
jgi:DNA-binding NtrC family response regulator